VRTKAPTALIIFIIGLVLCIIKMAMDGIPFVFEALELEVILPTGEEWVKGLVEGAIPQLPLTTLNSVVSVCALSDDLFRTPEAGGKGVTRVSVASSVGLMNVVGCFFGGMPSCHGAGGLAGQYKFGARTGCAILMLGVTKIILSLCLGKTLDAMIMYYPVTVLGVLLLFAGVELATVGCKGIWKSKTFEDDLLPCFCTAGAYIGSKIMALGTMCGVIAAVVQRLQYYHEVPGRILGTHGKAPKEAAKDEKPAAAPEPVKEPVPEPVKDADAKPVEQNNEDKTENV
jgi:hypothetical protein